MSIRGARADDHWRRAFSREYPNRYEQLDYSNLFCLGKGQIAFRSGITAVVGGNGVGKSTLAMALGEILEKRTSARFLANQARMCGSDLVGDLSEGGAAKKRTLSGATAMERQPQGDPIATESWWLDPGFWAFHTRAQVVRDQNFSELLESLAPVELDKGDLDLLSYLVGKKYERCTIFEIPDYADFDRFPYFRVQADGVEYGSEAMGQGELALLLVFWVVRDLKNNSILILEEPETHVSPRAQAALMNLLAQACDKKGLWVIVTTHSPTIVSRIPLDHVRVLIRDKNRVEIVEHAQRHQIAALLGGGGGYGGVMIVEDDGALWFTVALLEELCPDLLRQFEIVPAGSASSIVNALSAFPKTRKWFRLVGVFDGDQRGKQKSLQWPSIYLPGVIRPEALLRSQLANDASIDALAENLGKSRADVLIAIEATVGTDDHDWLPEIARLVNVHQSELVRFMVKDWVSTASGKIDAEKFIAELGNCYNA